LTNRCSWEPLVKYWKILVNHSDVLNNYYYCFQLFSEVYKEFKWSFYKPLQDTCRKDSANSQRWRGHNNGGLKIFFSL
jgi:hypothetical protein